MGSGTVRPAPPADLGLVVIRQIMLDTPLDTLLDIRFDQVLDLGPIVIPLVGGVRHTPPGRLGKLDTLNPPKRLLHGLDIGDLFEHRRGPAVPVGGQEGSALGHTFPHDERQGHIDILNLGLAQDNIKLLQPVHKIVTDGAVMEHSCDILGGAGMGQGAAGGRYGRGWGVRQHLTERPEQDGEKLVG